MHISSAGAVLEKIMKVKGFFFAAALLSLAGCGGTGDATDGSVSIDPTPDRAVALNFAPAILDLGGGNTLSLVGTTKIGSVGD